MMKTENLLKLWNERKYLTSHEAAALVCGLIPYTYPKASGEDRAVGFMQAELVHAMDRGELESIEPTSLPPEARRGGEDFWYTSPGGIVEWCKRRGLNADFVQLSPGPATAPQTTRLYPAAERSLLAIIAALCSLGEYDLSAPHSKDPSCAKAQIVGKFLGLKIEHAPGDRAVGDWLTKARDLPKE